MNKAVFLDRDDMLIKNIPYLDDPNRVQLLPRVKEALQKLKRAGCRTIFIATASHPHETLLARSLADPFIFILYANNSLKFCIYILIL